MKTKRMQEKAINGETRPAKSYVQGFRKEVRTMKNIVFKAGVMAAVLMLAGASLAVQAGCKDGFMVANFATGGQLNVPGALDDGTGAGTIKTKFWAQGQSGLMNSGALPTTYQVRSLGDSSYFIWSDWAWDQVSDYCPDATGRTVFLYSIWDGDTAKYILLSTAADKTRKVFDFGNVQNGNSPQGSEFQQPVGIPSLVVDSFESLPNVHKMSVSWERIKDLKGFYDQDPGGNLVRGVQVRYCLDSQTAKDHRVGNWQSATGGFVDFRLKGFDPGQAVVEVPNLPGLPVYLALSVVFDDGTPDSFMPLFAETDFVGPATEMPDACLLGPSFGRIAIIRQDTLSIKVNWSMARECDARFYEVVGVVPPSRRFTALSGPIAADGSAFYTHHIRGVTGVSQLRILAFRANGTVVSSITITL